MLRTATARARELPDTDRGPHSEHRPRLLISRLLSAAFYPLTRGLTALAARISWPRAYPRRSWASLVQAYQSITTSTACPHLTPAINPRSSRTARANSSFTLVAPSDPCAQARRQNWRGAGPDIGVCVINFRRSTLGGQRRSHGSAFRACIPRPGLHLRRVSEYLCTRGILYVRCSF